MGEREGEVMNQIYSYSYRDFDYSYKAFKDGWVSASDETDALGQVFKMDKRIRRQDIEIKRINTRLSWQDFKAQLGGE